MSFFDDIVLESSDQEFFKSARELLWKYVLFEEGKGKHPVIYLVPMYRARLDRILRDLRSA